MIKFDTSADNRWNMAFDELVGPMQEPKPLPPKAKREPKPPTAEQLSAAKASRKAKRRKAFWGKVSNWLTGRSRDLALCAIVIAAGVAVFDGSLYSATTFSFRGWSAYAFAIMPDALMVLTAAKMRQQGITPTQHEAARQAMRFVLWFSVATNMIAALLREVPFLAVWTVSFGPLAFRPVIVVGAVVYHGVVVLILKKAVDTITKVRAERGGNAKGGNESGFISALAAVAKEAPKALGRKASKAPKQVAK